MANYKLTKEARSDLQDIYRYGVHKHGQRQADEYYDGLIDQFQYIADNPVLYPAVDHIRHGYRRCVYGKHSVLYRLGDEAVEIMTIFRSQDIKNKLQ